MIVLRTCNACLPHALVIASGLERRRLALFERFCHGSLNFGLSFCCHFHPENDVANLTERTFFYQILTLHDVSLMLQNWLLGTDGHYKKHIQMLQKKCHCVDNQHNRHF
jgi:hypothetical protein